MGFTQELQESIMNAIQTTSQRAVMNSSATCTLQCEVTEVVDPGKNEYKVKVQNNIITAYGTPSVTYKPEDLVQVLFPNGSDQSDQDAIIIGSVTYSTELYVENGDSGHINIGENLINYSGQIELCTYKSEEKEIVLEENIFKEIFLDYLRDYQTQKFSLDIKTNIEPIEQRAAGNYGLILRLPILRDDGSGGDPVSDYYDIKVNVDNIEGDPYNLSSYTRQEIYIDIPADLKQDENKKSKLIAFVTGFPQAENKKNDIFMKNFSFQPQKALTEEEKVGYYMTLVSDTGRYFIGTNETKVIRPVLKVNGKDKNLKDYDCYQFRENATITPSNSKYCSYGKSGQECLNDYNSLGVNEDGTESIQQVTNDYQLDIKQNDIYTSMKFKCVLVDNSGKAIEPPGYITLTNKSRSDIEFNLKTSTGYSSYVKDTGNISLIASIKANNIVQYDLISTAQQRFDKTGNFLDTDFYTVKRSNDKKENGWIEYEISFPCSIIDEQNTIKCSFQREYKDNTTNEIKKDLIGSLELLVDTLGSYDYRIVIENGNYLFKYDGDGDSPLVADYNGPVSSRIKTIPSLTYRVYKADGTELTEDEYKYCKSTQVAPANESAYGTTTMFTFDTDYRKGKRDGYYHIENERTIKYGIASRFNDNALVNDINLIIEYDGARLEETTDIRFLKEGESGTNGSKYTGLILQNRCAYGEYENGYIHKFQLIYNENSTNNVYTPKGWYYVDRADTNMIKQFRSTLFTVQVYCNGEPNNTDIQSIEQSIFNDNIANSKVQIDATGKLTLKENADQSERSINIVQAKVKVGPKGDSTKPQEVIYIHYPIEISYITTIINSKMASLITDQDEIENLYVIPNINGGFDKVLYACDGTNPQYNNVNCFEYNDGLDDVTQKTNSYYRWEASGNLKEVSNSENDPTKRRYAALTTMETNNGLNYIKVTMENRTARGLLENKINEIKGQITSNTEERIKNTNIITRIGNLNAIQNTSIKRTLQDYLRRGKDFINNRSNMIKALDDALIDLNNFNTEYKALSLQDVTFNYNEIKAKIISIKNFLISLGEPVQSSSIGAILPEIEKFKTIDFSEGASKKILIDLNAMIDSYNKDIIIFNTYCDDYNNKYRKNPSNQNYFKYFLQNYLDSSNQPNILLKVADYKNLRDILNQLRQNLYSNKSESFIYTFADINSSTIDEFDKLINQYTDESSYITYKNKIDECNKNINDLNNQLSNYAAKYAIAINEFQAVHLKPIIMTMNTSLMSYLNDQDGNKLYTGGADSEYLFAPQVGAGSKNEEGKFTGITIGVRRADDPKKNDIGLFGYSKGTQSILLSADSGRAEFGKPGEGQIIIDPNEKNSAIIKSGDYDSGKGMKIIFNNNPEIRFGTGNFSVNSEGYVTAVGGGQIGGQQIGYSELKSKGSSPPMTLNPESEDLLGYPVTAYTTFLYGGDSTGFIGGRGTGYAILYIDKDGNVPYILLPQQNATPNKNEYGETISQNTTRGAYAPNFVNYYDKFYINPKTKAASGLSYYIIYDDNEPEPDEETLYLNDFYINYNIKDKAQMKMIKNTIPSNPDYTIHRGGKIYSGSHTNLSSKDPGFYLSSDGFSVGSSFATSSIEKDGGRVKMGNLNGNFQSIGESQTGFGAELNSVSYIKHNNGTDSLVYIGTDQIILGKDINLISSSGKIKAKDFQIKGNKNKTFNNLQTTVSDLVTRVGTLESTVQSLRNEITNIKNNYVTKTDLASTLNNYVQNSTLNSYAKKTEAAKPDEYPVSNNKVTIVPISNS